MHLFTMVEKKFCVEPLSPLYSTEAPARYPNKHSKKNSNKHKHAGEEGKSLSRTSNRSFRQRAVRKRLTLGSFSIDDGNGSENVRFKMNSRFFNLFSRLFQFAENGKCRRISLGLISWGPHSSLEREKEIRRRLFTSSIKLAIRHFHVVVVQGR